MLYTYLRSRVLVKSLFDAGDPPTLYFSSIMSWSPAPAWTTVGLVCAPQTAFIVNTAEYSPSVVTNARGLKSEMSVMAIMSSEMQSYFYGLSGGSLAQPTDDEIAGCGTPMYWRITDPARVVGWPITLTASNQVWIKPLGSRDGPEWAVALCNLVTTPGTSQSIYFSLSNVPRASRANVRKGAVDGADKHRERRTGGDELARRGEVVSADPLSNGWDKPLLWET